MNTQKPKVAFIGLGAMGSRMAKNLLKAGYALTVFNRTLSATDELAKSGATVASSPADAARDADFVIVMVRDDQASAQVWLNEKTGAIHTMKAGAIGIDSSTLTPAWTKKLSCEFEKRQLEFLEAPVSGSRPQAEMAQLVYLVGGKTETLSKTEDLLRLMSSSIQHIGEVGAGALTKLATNTLMGVQLTALAELIGILKKAGVEPEKVFQAVANTSVWSPVAGVQTKFMLNGMFSPMFPIELIEKDFGYTLVASEKEVSAPTIEAARNVFQQAIAKGIGGENMSAVVRLFTEE